MCSKDCLAQKPVNDAAAPQGADRKKPFVSAENATQESIEAALDAAFSQIDTLGGAVELHRRFGRNRSWDDYAECAASGMTRLETANALGVTLKAVDAMSYKYRLKFARAKRGRST